MLSVPQLVVAQASRRPAAVAIGSPDLVLTYGELCLRARRIAAELTRRGVASGTVVAVFAHRGPEALVSQLGVWWHGCAALVIDPGQPPDRIATMLEDARPSAILSADELRGLRDDGGRPPPAPKADDAPAYVIYTSGSTGTPKGVLVAHRSLAHLVRWHCHEYRVSPRDRASSVAATGFDAFLWETWPYLCAGASVHFAPEEARVSPWDLSDWLVAQDISLAFAPTPMAESYIRHGSRFEQVRCLLTGGDLLRLTAGHPLRRLVNHYGPTEATVVATSGAVDPAAQGPIHIGWPIPSAHPLILDDELSHVPPGETGELYLGGDCLARGYLGDPQRTQRAFVRIPGHPGRWYRTGDLVCVEPNGLVFKGRKDRQVKVRGVRVEPAEVEVVLGRHPGVADVVVQLDPGLGELVAFVVAGGRSIPSEAELRAHAAGALPSVMVPRRYRFVDRLPLTPNGKIDRARLSV